MVIDVFLAKKRYVFSHQQLLKSKSLKILHLLLFLVTNPLINP